MPRLCIRLHSSALAASTFWYCRFGDRSSCGFNGQNIGLSRDFERSGLEGFVSADQEPAHLYNVSSRNLQGPSDSRNCVIVFSRDVAREALSECKRYGPASAKWIVVKTS